MKKYAPFVIIFFFTTLFFIPFLKNQSILTERGNDLSGFFFPIFYFVKTSIYKYHSFPFWNNLFFSGTPLLPDPQSPLFYLPNIIFLLFKNIDLSFLISIYTHIFLSGTAMYLLAKKGFKFTTLTSTICAFFYIASPKLSGFIEAGHYGLIASWSWIPLVILFTILLSRKPTLKTSILLSIFLSFIFYTHVLIFIILVVSISIFYLYLCFKDKSSLNKKFLFFIISGIFCFGLIAITFIPQLSWQKETTRNLLLSDADIYPKWLGIKEFISSIISPIFLSPKFIWNLDTEKIIALGLFPVILSCMGFIKSKSKVLLLITIGFVFLLSLNNISPIYNILVHQNWYILLRVSTRVWFLIIIIFIYLSGSGIEHLLRNKKHKLLTFTLISIAITEILLTSWTRVLKPISIDPNLAPKEVYEFLSADKDKFRVFCLNRCLSQKQSALYGLELADGYGTLQQINYYINSEQLSQAFYRNKYTLSIPPFEIFTYENLQPYSPNLSQYNIKYVISDHILKDKNLKIIKKVQKYFIYQNTINNKRSNYPITYYSPNKIDIDTSDYKENYIILSEVYNKDWSAVSNLGKLSIKETQNGLRQVEINKDTKFVDFIYNPLTFKIGFIITFVTIVICLKILLF